MLDNTTKPPRADASGAGTAPDDRTAAEARETGRKPGEAAPEENERTQPSGTEGGESDADESRPNVLRRHPVALAWLAEQHVAAQVEAMRQAYRTVRVDLAEALPEGTVDALLVCLEHEGLRLRSAQRSILLIREALDGSVFVDRL